MTSACHLQKVKSYRFYLQSIQTPLAAVPSTKAALVQGESPGLKSSGLKAEMGLRVPVFQAEQHKTLLQIGLLTMWGHIMFPWLERADSKHRKDGWIGSFLGLRGPKQILKKSKGKKDRWASGKDPARPHPLSCSISLSGTAELTPLWAIPCKLTPTFPKCYKAH